MGLLRVFILFCSSLCVFSRQCCAQAQTSKYITGANAELGTYISTGSQTPFWLRTNQFGIVPLSSPSGVIQASVFKDYRQPDSLTHKSPNFDWGYVVNPVLTYDQENRQKFILPEAYVKVRFRWLEFYAGRRRQLMGLGDSTLTSGFYAVSGNAIPLPKIQLATIGFVPFIFRKFLAINASFSHGWLNNPPSIYAARLHQKHLYFRVGKPTGKIKLYFGLNHQVMWSGHSDYLLKHPELAQNGQLADSWKFYQYVVLSYTPKDWYKIAGYTSYDSYRIGDHLGSYDAAIEAKIKGNELMLYHQHPYEDVSGILFKNVPDGLWGASLKIPESKNRIGGFQMTRITLEFLTTKDQSGSSFVIPGSLYQGGDNYFNHGQYIDGWSYLGNTIGTPFIAPRKDLAPSSQLSTLFFPNTVLNMWHMGLQGTYGKSMHLSLRASYSINSGIYGRELTPARRQFSSMLTAQFPVVKWYNTAITAKLGLDNGTLYTKSFGGYLGIKKSW